MCGRKLWNLDIEGQSYESCGMNLGQKKLYNDVDLNSRTLSLWLDLGVEPNWFFVSMITFWRKHIDFICSFKKKAQLIAENIDYDQKMKMSSSNVNMIGFKRKFIVMTMINVKTTCVFAELTTSD